MTEFPFDDIERLEREEDELPIIPEWPTIIHPPKTTLDQQSSEK